MTVFKALKRNILSTRYLFIFLLFLLLVFNSLFQEFVENIGLSEFFIRTASEVSFLQNNLTRHYMTVLTIIGPLLTVIACSSLFNDDYEANMLSCIFTRTSASKYHLSNIIAVLISAFLLIFSPLILGYLISLIACNPNVAFDNMNAFPTFFIRDYSSDLLNMWETFNPIIFTLFHILLVSIIFSLCACLGYVISMGIKWNRYISISIVFGSYLIYNVGLTKLKIEKITFFNLIDPYSQKASIPIIFTVIVVFILLIILLFAVLLRKNGDVDG